MNQMHTSNRLVSVAVVVALVAVTALMTCGVALGAPIGGSGTPAPSDACGLSTHMSMGATAVSAEALELSVELHALLPAETTLAPVRGTGNGEESLAADELPPPLDPRHGRIRV